MNAFTRNETDHDSVVRLRGQWEMDSSGKWPVPKNLRDAVLHLDEFLSRPLRDVYDVVRVPRAQPRYWAIRSSGPLFTSTKPNSHALDRSGSELSPGLSVWLGGLLFASR